MLPALARRAAAWGFAYAHCTRLPDSFPAWLPRFGKFFGLAVDRGRRLGGRLPTRGSALLARLQVLRQFVSLVDLYRFRRVLIVRLHRLQHLKIAFARRRNFV